MLIGKDHSSLQTDLTVPHHLQPPPLPPSSTLYLAIPSSNRRATVVTDKETRLLGEWDRNGECGREKEARKEVGEGSRNVSPSAEQKNGVCASCERGEIAFSFHFTRLPFSVQPSPFTSRPLLHTFTAKHTCTHPQSFSPPSFCDCQAKHSVIVSQS